MKLMKRLTALALSAAMVLSMSVSALATGETNSTPTDAPSVVNNEEQISYTWKNDEKGDEPNPSIAQGEETHPLAPFNGETNLFENVENLNAIQFTVSPDSGSFSVGKSGNGQYISVEANSDCAPGSYTLTFDNQYTLPVTVEEKSEPVVTLCYDGETLLTLDANKAQSMNVAPGETIKFEVHIDGKMKRLTPERFNGALNGETASNQPAWTTYEQDDDDRNIRAVVTIPLNAENGDKLTFTFQNSGNEPLYTFSFVVAEPIITEIASINKVDSSGNLTDNVLIDLANGNTKRFAPGEYSRFALVVNGEAQSLKGAVVTVEGAEGEDNTDPDEWIINYDSFVALRVPYDAKTDTKLVFDVAGRTFVFKVKDGSHVYTLRALVGDDWVDVDDNFTISGETTVRALCDGTALNLVVGRASEQNFRVADVGPQVSMNMNATSNGTDGTVNLIPVAAGSTVYLYYGIHKMDNVDAFDYNGCVLLGTVTISEEAESYKFIIDGKPLSDNRKTLSADEVGKEMTIQLKDTSGNPVDHSKISFGGVFKNVVVADDKNSLSITPMGIAQINYEVKDNSNTTLYTITLRLEYADSPAYFVSGHDGEVVTEITVENLEPVQLGLQYGYGISNYKISEFTILDSKGNDVTQRNEAHNLVACGAFEFTAGASYGITLYFNPNVTPSDSYTLIFDRKSANHHAELKIIFDIPEIGYGLYDDERTPMSSMPIGSATGNIITQKTALNVWELKDGIPTTNVTAQIQSIGNIIVEDTRDLVSAEDAAKCLSIKQEEGTWFINTTPYQEGNYKASFDIILTNGTVKTFTVTYLVNSGVGSSNIVYNVGASDSIQSAIDKAVASTNRVVSHNIVLQEGATYSENLTLTVAAGHQAKIDIIGNGATLNGTITYNTPENYDEQEVIIRDLTIEAGTDNTAVTIKGNPEELFLQNVTIDGAKVGISGLPMASETRNVTISNCETALAPIGTLYDISKHTLREWNFIDNAVAIDLNSANGQFKIRESQFSGNTLNINAESTECAYINAAFNNYLHEGVNAGESIASYFALKDDNAHYFYSPYTSKSTASRAATSDFYIDPDQMKGLIIDAEEAEQVVNSSNFKSQDIVIDIVETTENEETGFTTSKAYATWNFGTDVTANAVAMDFTPRIDRELSEASQAVVDAEGITSYQPVSFAHSGDLPAVATVELNETVALSGELYLYKVVDGELVLQEEGVSYENGIYTFDRPTCSDYIITDVEIKDEETPPSGGEGETDKPGSGETDKPGSGETDKPGSGETDKPNQGGSFTPFVDDDSNNYIPVSEVKNKLNSSSKDTVTLNVESKDQLSAKIFEELAKHPEKTLVLKGDGYTLSIKGEDVVRKLSSSIFDADIRSSSPNRTKIRNLIGYDAKIQYIHSDFHGMLPGEMTLRIKVDDSLKGKILNAYHYDEKLDALELVANGLKTDAKGYVEFSIDHFSTYILTDSMLNVEHSVSVDKINPSTGANDVVALAAAMAVVSLMGAAALDLKR